MSYSKYKREMLHRFKTYRRQHYPLQDELFDERYCHVFKPRYSEYNLFNPDLGKSLPRNRRHRWFRSMGSSQALAVSVFGTMMRRDDLLLLTKVLDNNRHPLLPGFVLEGQPRFDYRVKRSTLNEPRPTQVDLFLPCQKGNVAIECKFWESELEPCSQVPDECNGNYSAQPRHAPGQRCALTERGIAYWNYIPRLFHWRADVDHKPCPIWKPFQLVRNVLAAAIDPTRQQQAWGQPVAVLVYDARNPAFASGGKVYEQFQHVQAALRGQVNFKRTTWQAIAGALTEQGGYNDLLAWLDEKYGIKL